MHTFLSVLPDRLVFVDVPEWTEAHDAHPGWDVICRAAVVEQKLMAEAEARNALFSAAQRPDKASQRWG